MADRKVYIGKPQTRGKALTIAVVFLIWMICGNISMPEFALSASKYPQAAGNINDYVGVLSQDDRVNLEALVNSVLEQTGATFAVAIVGDTGDDDLLGYSVGLYEEWGLGQKGEDKGLLILVSMEDRGVRAEVGYGLEHIITDARAGDCLDQMMPYFQEEQYGKGIYSGLLHAAKYVASAEGIELQLEAASSDYGDTFYKPPQKISWFLFPFLIIPLAIGGIFSFRGRRCPRCKSKLTVVDKVVQRATYDTGGLALRVYQCPKCGYRDQKTYRTSRLSRPSSGFPLGPGPFFGGGSGRTGGGVSGPRGFGGGRSGGGGASRRW